MDIQLFRFKEAMAEDGNLREKYLGYLRDGLLVNDHQKGMNPPYQLLNHFLDSIAKELNRAWILLRSCSLSTPPNDPKLLELIYILDQLVERRDCMGALFDLMEYLNSCMTAEEDGVVTENQESFKRYISTVTTCEQFAPWEIKTTGEKPGPGHFYNWPVDQPCRLGTPDVRLGKFIVQLKCEDGSRPLTKAEMDSFSGLVQAFFKSSFLNFHLCTLYMHTRTIAARMTVNKQGVDRAYHVYKMERVQASSIQWWPSREFFLQPYEYHPKK